METFWGIFPFNGKNRAHFSTQWKIFKAFFHSMEIRVLLVFLQRVAAFVKFLSALVHFLADGMVIVVQQPRKFFQGFALFAAEPFRCFDHDDAVLVAVAEGANPFEAATA